MTRPITQYAVTHYALRAVPGIGRLYPRLPENSPVDNVHDA